MKEGFAFMNSRQINMHRRWLSLLPIAQVAEWQWCPPLEIFMKVFETRV